MFKDKLEKIRMSGESLKLDMETLVPSFRDPIHLFINLLIYLFIYLFNH